MSSLSSGMSVRNNAQSRWSQVHYPESIIPEEVIGISNDFQYDDMHTLPMVTDYLYDNASNPSLASQSLQGSSTRRGTPPSSADSLYDKTEIYREFPKDMDMAFGDESQFDEDFENFINYDYSITEDAAPLISYDKPDHWAQEEMVLAPDAPEIPGPIHSYSTNSKNSDSQDDGSYSKYTQTRTSAEDEDTLQRAIIAICNTPPQSYLEDISMLQVLKIACSRNTPSDNTNIIPLASAFWGSLDIILHRISSNASSPDVFYSSDIMRAFIPTLITYNYMSIRTGKRSSPRSIITLSKISTATFSCQIDSDVTVFMNEMKYKGGEMQMGMVLERELELRYHASVELENFDKTEDPLDGYTIIQRECVFEDIFEVTTSLNVRSKRGIMSTFTTVYQIPTYRTESELQKTHKDTKQRFPVDDILDAEPLGFDRAEKPRECSRQFNSEGLALSHIGEDKEEDSEKEDSENWGEAGADTPMEDNFIV
ncbi:hypothetical protein ABW20_dc0106655 [Dactylellina cionopaga]|nr:hypothetical protein ABW20_dc0106655 [Dactylellina cionopaga]